jgi:hypothetical protein
LRHKRGALRVSGAHDQKREAFGSAARLQPNSQVNLRIGSIALGTAREDPARQRREAVDAPVVLLPAAVGKGALALTVAVLGMLAAGCGNSGGHPAATATASTPRSSAPCKLDRAQRHTVARALADIRLLRRIQARMHTFSQHGAPNQEALTGKFLLDLGSTELPVNVFSHLLHLAKTAVSLCGDCSQGLETEEPFLGNRGRDTSC